MFIYPIYYHNWRNIITIYIYLTRLTSNEIFSPSNKIHREVCRAKDLSALRYNRLWKRCDLRLFTVLIYKMKVAQWHHEQDKRHRSSDRTISKRQESLLRRWDLKTRIHEEQGRMWYA